MDGARARRNSLGIVNFRCNVISIRVFRMNYWPVPLIPSGGYIWYSLLQPTIRSILRQVYPSGGSIISCIFYTTSLLFATCFRSGCATTKNRCTLRNSASEEFRVIMFNSSRQDKEFSFFIPAIGIRGKLFRIEYSRRTIYYYSREFKDFFNEWKSYQMKSEHSKYRNFVKNIQIIPRSLNTWVTSFIFVVNNINQFKFVVLLILIVESWQARNRRRLYSNSRNVD